MFSWFLHIESPFDKNDFSIKMTKSSFLDGRNGHPKMFLLSFFIVVPSFFFLLKVETPVHRHSPLRRLPPLSTSSDPRQQTRRHCSSKLSLPLYSPNPRLLCHDSRVLLQLIVQTIVLAYTHHPTTTSRSRSKKKKKKTEQPGEDKSLQYTQPLYRTPLHKLSRLLDNFLLTTIFDL